jgi:AcrR family transcriptional regulator
MNSRSQAGSRDAVPVASRAQRRLRATLERVLEAATHLFAEQGFTDTSMASIASAADVSVGTLYNLFDNKDALYLELVRSKAELFRDRLLAALGAPGSPQAALDRFLAELLRLFREEAIAIRLYYRVSAQARISFRASLAEPIRALFDETTIAFARLIDPHSGNNDPTPAAYRAAMCCHAMVNELLLLHIDDPVRHPEPAVRAEATRLMHAVTAPFVADGAASAEKRHKERSR